VPRLEGREPVQRLHSLTLGRDRAPAPPLVGGDDDMYEALEEVALLLAAGAPGELERLVCLEELSAAGQLEALLVVPIHSANVGVSYGNDPAARGRPLRQGKA
jgi:hypothetical protein